MTKRILLAILAVATLSVAAFGVPLAVVVRRVERDDTFSSLQRSAAGVAAEVPTRLDGSVVEVPRLRDRDDVVYAVYDANGRRVAGDGPLRADKVVRSALGGRLAQYTDSAQLSVGWPLTANERTYGAVRAAVPESKVEDRIRSAWLVMGVLGLVVISVAALLAWWLSRRLARPVHALAGAASRLGDEDFTVTVESSGVPELDRAGDALTATAGRLGRLIARERNFSADASHQLRTPLTGLRLVLESAAAGADDPREVVEPALREVDRLQATVDDLLRLARADRPQLAPVDPSPLLVDEVATWQARAGQRHRPVRLALPEEVPPARITPEALKQIVEVLIANAFEHGGGTITVSARTTPGGVAIEVHDEGPGVTGDPESVFERGVGTGHGIGLSLARSLAEAEGCRLTLVSPGPRPTFRLLIPADTDAAGAEPAVAATR